MNSKLEYTGLTTRRIAVAIDSPLLTASVRQNKMQVNNNGWEHDDKDEITIDKPYFDLTLE